jgi:hypothetical protein
MTRYIPIGLAILLIVGLTIVQINMTDRFAGANVTAEQRGKLLTMVPKSFGDWQSEDKPVDPEVQKTAGAMGVAISRDYRNTRTGEKVGLWLIVGHARDIAFHTPDVCYPASGFVTRSRENSLYPMVVQGLPDTPFWTNTFYKEDQLSGRTLIRVFWTWFNPEGEENSGKIVWEAPSNARRQFGNTRAIYKMYFSSEMHDQMETAEQSACLHFARDFLPVIDKILSDVNHMQAPGAAADVNLGETPATPAADTASEAAKPEGTAEPAADEKAATPAAAPAEGSTPAEPAAPPAEPAKQ